MCEGHVALDAAIYPDGLCRVIIRGATDQLKADGYVRLGMIGLIPPDDDLDRDQCLTLANPGTPTSTMTT